MRILPVASITLKNIPEPLYEKLREAAKLHHRSINSELIACLEQLLMPKRWTADAHLAEARTLRSKVKAAPLSARVIDEAKREGRA